MGSGQLTRICIHSLTCHLILAFVFTTLFVIAGSQAFQASSHTTNDLLPKRDSKKSSIACPDRKETNPEESDCPKNCTLDSKCSFEHGEQCLCFGECGLSCINKQKAYCRHPGFIENGKVVYVGPTGLYELRYLKQKVPMKGHVLYECDQGFALVDGPLGKICEEGMWEPFGIPKCVNTLSPGFHWLQTGRLKRRAIKTGGSSSIVRSKAGPGGGSGGLGTRRSKKGKNRFGEEDESEITPIFCPDLDLDPYILTEVIQAGEQQNETSSAGSVVKVSCKPGFGVNLPNETVRCENGNWKPKIPQCSELPCKTPYIMHGTFYKGVYPLYFQESKTHKTTVDVKCAKGYKLRGHPKAFCWYGEWDLGDQGGEAPQCLAAPCKLPTIEFGNYINFETGKTLVHGAEVDYSCSGGYRKLLPGPVRCELGEWKPSPPYCVHPSGDHDPNGKKGGKKSNIRKSCGTPQKQKGAYTYVAGLPLDWNTQFSFPDATEVLYRCSTAALLQKNQKVKAKNKWKLTCEDGVWIKNVNVTCDEDAPNDKYMNLPILSMINGSCTYRKVDDHVVTFYDDEILMEDKKEFPHGTILASRCVDIGKFRLEGAKRRQCISGQWLGITSRCEGLSQYQDYLLDKPPTILFRYYNGSIVQSTDGNLVVYPGTTLHMECLWLRKFGTPSWKTSNPEKQYPEGWVKDPIRYDQLEYRITIENAQDEDSGTFSCKTPARHTHEIKIIVKEANCPPLPEHPDLEYSTNDTILGTRVNFTCKHRNSLIGAEEIFCSATGKWSAPLPRCENVECLDISLVPAMAPLAYTSVTKNGTLKRNETAPPKVTVFGTQVGAKAMFACEQGYMVEGSAEASCQPNGEWSASMPLCKEVECPLPPIPENGNLVGQPPQKFKAGDFATFECKAGYMMEGQPLLACQDNGKWSKANGVKCKVGCSYPGTLIYGTLSQIKFYYEIGETVEFECQDGFELQGAKKMHCQKAGKWSTIIPTCSPQHYDHVSNANYFVAPSKNSI